MPRSKKDKQPSFEQALEELENMVETMESGQLPLEELITSYEQGAKLIAHCETVLDDARERLELLTLKPSSDGNNSPTNQAANTPTQQSQPNNDDDEIRLF